LLILLCCHFNSQHSLHKKLLLLIHLSLPPGCCVYCIVQHTYSCISFRPDGLLLAGTFSNGNIEVGEPRAGLSEQGLLCAGVN